MCDDSGREGEFGSSIVTGSSPLRATVQRRHGEKASRFQACGWLVGFGPIFDGNVGQISRVATCRNVSQHVALYGPPTLRLDMDPAPPARVCNVHWSGCASVGYAHHCETRRVLREGFTTGSQPTCHHQSPIHRPQEENLMNTLTTHSLDVRRKYRLAPQRLHIGLPRAFETEVVILHNNTAARSQQLSNPSRHCRESPWH